MRTVSKFAAALAVLFVTLITFALPSVANINSISPARGTIFVQSMTPGDSWTADSYTYGVNYLEGLVSSNGVNWNVVAAACRIGSPCVHWVTGSWGATGWDGMTYPAASCSANTSCSWDGSGERADHTSDYWTTIKINKSYSHTSRENNSVACHEYGHAIPGLQHAGGSTCMQATGYSYVAYQATEVIEIRNKFANITRVAYKPSYTIVHRNAVEKKLHVATVSPTNSPVTGTFNGIDVSATARVTDGLGHGTQLKQPFVYATFTSYYNTTAKASVHVYGSASAAATLYAPLYVNTVGDLDPNTTQNVALVCYQYALDRSNASRLVYRVSERKTFNGTSPLLTPFIRADSLATPTAGLQAGVPACS